jgi:type IV secretory pathway VirB10-like protein
MEPESQAQTEIIEEKPARAVRSKAMVWTFIGTGGALIVMAVVFLFIGPLKKPTRDRPILTAEDREQQRYDSQQEEQARNKASQLQNAPFLLRKGSDSEASAQAESLFRELNRDKALSSQSKAGGDSAKAEEALIASVIREPRPQAPAEPSYRASHPPAATPTGSGESDKPMFVYSRSFGGAKYHDAAKKETTTTPRTAVSDSLPAVRTVPQSAEPKTEAKDPKPTLLYTELSPVTLFEGEVLEAVLVNRIIADTEPSPVICHLSKDIFDNSGQFVVFPANSRIVGYSQVVNYKGAHRLFISFHRIILPNGPSVDFPQSSKALKALDETGALGVVSKVDRHWWLQFGTAILVGVLDGLGAAAQRSGDLFSRQAIIIDNTSRNFGLILDRIMEQYSNIVPTITVQQGKKLKIHLSDDLLVTPYARTQDRSYATQ